MARWIARLPLIGLFVLSIFGLAIDFLPATWWSWTSLVLTLLWSYRYRDWLRRMCFGEDRGLFETSMSFMLGVILMRTVIVRTAGGAITLFLGHHAVIGPVVVHIHHTGYQSHNGSGRCRDQWRSDGFDNLGGIDVCVKDAYEVATPGFASTSEGCQAEAKLVGARGPFGFFIWRLYILRDIKPEEIH